MKHAIVKYRVDLGVYSICRSSEFSGSGLAYNVMLVFSERELMFTFAKNHIYNSVLLSSASHRL